MSIFVAGLDLGQAQDHSALVITEAHGTMYTDISPAYPTEGPPLVHVDVRYILRYDLGTKYDAVAGDVRQRIAKVPAPKYLVVDETGVGRPVVELLAQLGLHPHGITIASGGNATLAEPMHVHVPKRDLVGGAQVCLQNRILRIGKDLPHAELLVRELLAFRAKISEAGHDTYAAWRERDHDDLVLAASMAVWFAREAFAYAYAQEMERRAWAATPRYEISPV